MPRPLTTLMSDRIEKQIFLRAPISRVWRAISDTGEFGQWFGVRFDAGSFTPGEEINGRITIKGYEHVVWNARVEQVIPPRLLSFRWHPNATDSSVDYSTEPTTLVQFELQEAEGGTLLTLVESGFDAVPEWRRAAAFRGNEKGWEGQLGNIERHVAGSR
jgi:uncharacterized protein YndB with AHSA1/START domain